MKAHTRRIADVTACFPVLTLASCVKNELRAQTSRKLRATSRNLCAVIALIPIELN